MITFKVLIKKREIMMSKVINNGEPQGEIRGS